VNPKDHSAWLSLTREDPVDRHRQIVDAHHHLHQAGSRKDPYLLEDMLANTRAGHNVTHAVFVEAGTAFLQQGPDFLRSVGETEFVAGEARRSRLSPTRVAAIIAFGDLTVGLGELDEMLDAHEAAGSHLFRGIRYATTWDASPEVYSGGWPGWMDPPPGLMGEERFRRGVARLGEKGYCFEAYLYHHQIPELATLAGFSETMTMILDHTGMPLNVGPYTDREVVRSDWKAGLKQLVAHPNVILKLGGMGMDSWFFGRGWAANERPPGSDEVVECWRDDLRWCIDTFGPSRCMFESNYPTDRATLDYTVIWNAFQKIASVYSDKEQDTLFAGTAARAYGMNLHD
jgi:L-fuconolactonase